MKLPIAAYLLPGFCQGPWNVDLRTPPGPEGSNGSLLCIRRGHPGFLFSLLFSTAFLNTTPPWSMIRQKAMNHTAWQHDRRNCNMNPCCFVPRVTMERRFLALFGIVWCCLALFGPKKLKKFCMFDSIPYVQALPQVTHEPEIFPLAFRLQPLAL